jgi:hypothetical protein
VACIRQLHLLPYSGVPDVLEGLDPEVRGEHGDDLLAHIESLNQGRIHLQNVIYDQAEEVAKFAIPKEQKHEDAANN